jgi:hypothetical protein
MIDESVDLQKTVRAVRSNFHPERFNTKADPHPLPDVARLASMLCMPRSSPGTAVSLLRHVDSFAWTSKYNNYGSLSTWLAVLHELSAGFQGL